MTASLTSAAVAPLAGLPIFALGEHVRERRLRAPHTEPIREDTPMSRYKPFDRLARNTSALVAEYRKTAAEAVESPEHYTWLGRELAELGLSDAANVESWDVLDAAFPSDPLLWNCGKYLLRQGRKGGEEKRLEDLRKARQYLDRKIAQLSRGGE